MRELGKTGIVISIVLSMFLGSLPPITPAAEENGAEGRAAVKAPEWKVNDFWRYEYKQRPDQFQIPGWMGPYSGHTEYSGTIDYYQYLKVVDTTVDWYQVYYLSETWQNGTYIWYPDGRAQSGEGRYNIYIRNETTGPELIRKSDLNNGGIQRRVTINNIFTATSDGMWKLGNLMETDYDNISFPNGPVSMYRFPLEFGRTWAINGTVIEHLNGSFEQEIDAWGTMSKGTGYTIDTTTYRAVSASTGPDYETQNCPYLPLFTDCCRIRLSGTVDVVRTGKVIIDGQPFSVDDNFTNQPLDSTRWFSPRAGNFVNYDSFSSTTGIRLTDYRHDYIPPNYKPALETVAGLTASPSTPVEVSVREGEPTAVELRVRDEDAGDKLNWSVAKIDGTGNTAGAVLMDGAPDFTVTGPTEPNAFKVHTNKLLITATQPRTVDSDRYAITINVNDGNEDGSTNFSFKVRVLNVNNAPYATMAVPDVWIRENSTMDCSTWKLSDIFRDRDIEAGISDPLSFAASVSAGPAMKVTVDGDTGAVSFAVPDYADERTAPSGWDGTVRYTCTDSGSGDPASRISTAVDGNIHVEHVNHDPDLSPNGTDILKYGLTWAEDTSDNRLDLNKAFSDPDTRYTGDILNFTYSGNSHILVNETAGRVTLIPRPDWNGRESVNFTANDTLGRTKRIQVDCTVYQVPDPPVFCETRMAIVWNSTAALAVKEAAGPAGPLTTLKLAVNVTDADEIMGAADPHSCQWWVYDKTGNLLSGTGKSVLGDDKYDFKCNWTGPFSSRLGPYQVRCAVKDTFGLTATYLWNVTVTDMNRPPVPSIERPKNYASFTKGTHIHFDAWNSSDPDESRENLTFIWRSSKQGLLNQDGGEAGAVFSTWNLKPGKHVITLTVQDSEGCETSAKVTVTFGEPSQVPGFEGIVLLASVTVIVPFLVIRRRKQQTIWFREKGDG